MHSAYALAEFIFGKGDTFINHYNGAEMTGIVRNGDVEIIYCDHGIPDWSRNDLTMHQYTFDEIPRYGNVEASKRLSKHDIYTMLLSSLVVWKIPDWENRELMIELQVESNNWLSFEVQITDMDGFEVASFNQNEFYPILRQHQRKQLDLERELTPQEIMTCEDNELLDELYDDEEI